MIIEKLYDIVKCDLTKSAEVGFGSIEVQLSKTVKSLLYSSFAERSELKCNSFCEPKIGEESLGLKLKNSI